MTTVTRLSEHSAFSVIRRVKNKTTNAPFSAMIEIADRCNEVCVHCYQIQGQKGEMSTEDIKKVLDELAEMGVLLLVISGGEPTLRSDFLEIVEHARRRRFAIKIYSNGLKITTELARRLGELGVLEVQMSLYSHRAEIHDWMTRVAGSFDRTVAAARDLIETGIHVVLKTPLMSVNADEYAEYIDFVTGLGADFRFDRELKAREDGDRTPQALGISEEQYLRISRDPRVAPQDQGEDEPLEPGALDRAVCGACQGNVHVEPNGQLNPCTQLAIPTGHAVRDGVKAAWRGNSQAHALRQLTWADLHGCRDCDLRGVCNRCYATAQAEGGDPLGPYETACRNARLAYEARYGAVRIRAESADGRPTSRGPYRHAGGNTFRTVDDVVTQRDRDLAEQYSWFYSAPSSSPQDLIAPGKLVRVRRPGKQPREEQVPAPRTATGER